jgi:hypothetical protein
MSLEKDINDEMRFDNAISDVNRIYASKSREKDSLTDKEKINTLSKELEELKNLTYNLKTFDEDAYEIYLKKYSK